MGDISKNFNRYEFACKCGCGYNTVDTELVPPLEMVRNHFELIYWKVYIYVESGARCPGHNQKVGGADNSQHLLGKAADIQVFKWMDGEWEQINPSEVYQYLDAMFQDYYGIGNYKTFTHFDVRAKKARF